MPLYIYACETCGETKDVICKFSEAHPVVTCVKCGTGMIRQIGAPIFKLKGSCWAKDNYGGQK